MTQDIVVYYLLDTISGMVHLVSSFFSHTVCCIHFFLDFQGGLMLLYPDNAGRVKGKAEKKIVDAN